MNYYYYMGNNNKWESMLHQNLSLLCPHMGINIIPHHRHHRWFQWRQQRRRTTTCAVAVKEKPPECTADELHYVSIPSDQWQLALWRYHPTPTPNSSGKSRVRNHPLLMLSGVGTNALGFDLSPQTSFARHMSENGFDTWVLEVRGAGLSKRELQPAQNDQFEYRFNNWVKGVSDFVRDSRTSIPLELPVLNADFIPTVQEFQRQADLFLSSNCDFDQYVTEDLPLVMEYIREQTKPIDGKLLAIGHSMGGILLYSLLSLCGFEKRESHLAAVATLASSLNYSSSRSSLKLLLPLVEPAEAINLKVVPMGAVISALYPLASYPPFLMSWLNSHISAQDMMLPELYERLVLKNFCTVPAKLLLQLSTVFESTGLSNRDRTFNYNDHLHKTNVPILALAGDRDLICPPEAVYETVKVIPENMVTYKVFGELEGPHYAHYDIVGGRFAAKQVYPCLVDFLSAHDSLDC